MRLGTGVNAARNPAGFHIVDAGALALMSIADGDVLRLHTCVDSVKGVVRVSPEVVDNVNTSVTASPVAEDDVLLLESVAYADLEGPAPSAVLVDAASAVARSEGQSGTGADFAKSPDDGPSLYHAWHDYQDRAWHDYLASKGPGYTPEDDCVLAAFQPRGPATALFPPASQCK